MIDPFHLEKYGISSVNYNRDIAAFPILKSTLAKITGKDIYYSPTDMGVNMISKAIISDDIVSEASKKEILRRFYQETCNLKIGSSDEEAVQKVHLLVNELNIDDSILPCINASLEKSKIAGKHVVAIELPNGNIVTGKETDILSASSSAVINAIKEITKIPDEIDLLSDTVLKPILKLKENSLTDFNKKLHLQEVLIALSICAVTNPVIQKALNNINKLNGCDAHSTCILFGEDLKVLKSLKINLTCEPVFYLEK